ncbi:hemerythrin HHE cation binding domain-containing protein [Micromonospora pisi]|uniref:Hemerythrin HHE cation binding domain-containing protein n=1 Tax=Micromonospora pisi TaxID=589240 RepID=A0A495JMU5_9ACTN|nr:hemerythrin domain-containing protein [Micromonospora pisi]RKR90287.1 hemerythrin HHE cation binding domain-containing protein [Micromonospora pisi]
MTTIQEQDVLDLLHEQHNQIKALFGQLSRAQGTEKRELFEDLVRLLAVHESAEEIVVHPRAERKIEGGADVVQKRRHEEDQAKRELSALYDLGVEHPDFDSRLSTFADAVVEHASREESEEFPSLRRNSSPEQLRRMAGALRAAEAMAPTRPHPHSGESRTANLVAGPPMALFDRLRDAVRDWRESHRDQD